MCCQQPGRLLSSARICAARFVLCHVVLCCAPCPQGPFSAEDMFNWCCQGLLPMDLPLHPGAAIGVEYKSCGSIQWDLIGQRFPGCSKHRLLPLQLLQLLHAPSSPTTTINCSCSLWVQVTLTPPVPLSALVHKNSPIGPEDVWPMDTLSGP